jgi:hypothetical protein
MKRTPARLIGTLIAAVALLALPAAAQAAFTVTGTAAPTNNDAGAHSDFHIHLDFSGGQVKDLTVGLPPGQVGDPTATPTCTQAQLNSATAGNDGCPANTQVGSVVANATITVVILPVTLDVSGKLYNLTPHPGEPARFGIVLQPGNLLGALTLPLPPIILESGVQLRPDYGLNTIINNIPNSTQGLPTTINSQDITLFGTAPGTGRHFMRNPTSCPGPHTTNFTATPWSGSADTDSATFTTDNCGALDFSPAFTAEVGGPGQTTNGVPTTASTSIIQDNDEAGLRNAAVLVPSDLNPNATLFFGTHCDQASFVAGTCPSNTVVGLATASSPLLAQPLVGNVELVTGSGAFPNLGLDLRGALHLLLQGTTAINPNSVTFNGLPDIPISRFQLTFTNPPALLGTTRDLCVPPAPVFHADFTGYNGASTSVAAPATVDGCGPSSGGTSGKCKAAKKKKHKHRAAEAKKKHKKKSCKKKKRKKKR